MEYRIQLSNVSGTEIFYLPYTAFSYTEVLNRGVQGSVTCSYEALKTYAEKLGDTYNGMLKGELRELIIWRGTTKLHTLVLNQKKNSKGGTVQLFFSDYLAMLGTRITGNEGTKYTSTDSAEIAWDEIDASQTKTNGDFGLTLGSQPTTKDRQRTLRFDTLQDLIVGMSRYKVKDGYDVEINASKQVNFFYPTKGQTKSEVVFSERNTIAWSVEEGMAGEVFNKVAVLGSGAEDDMTSTTREDTTNQAKWLLSEAVLSEKGVGDTDELDDRGDRFLEENDSPEDNREVSVSHVDGTPNITDYSLGDSVTVRIEKEDIDTTMRVISRKVKYSKGSVTVDIDFE